MTPKKKYNAISNALTSVYNQMFPGGKREEFILTTELYNLLGGRIQIKTVNQALCFALSYVILLHAKSKDEILNANKSHWTVVLVEDNEVFNFQESLTYVWFNACYILFAQKVVTESYGFVPNLN